MILSTISAGIRSRPCRSAKACGCNINDYGAAAVAFRNDLIEDDLPVNFDLAIEAESSQYIIEKSVVLHVVAATVAFRNDLVEDSQRVNVDLVRLGVYRDEIFEGNLDDLA